MKFIILVVCFLFGAFTFAQKYAFQAFSTSEGLPQSQVNTICQDDDGYLWIGTLGGVARFNGNSFKTYSSENGLHNNRISSLKWIDNVLWVGHDGGVSIIRKNNISSIAFPEDLKTVAVSDIVKFNNEIIISLNGGGLFKITNNKLVEIKGLTENQQAIRDMQVYKGRLYCATREGIVVTSNLKTFKLFLPHLNMSVSAIDVMHDDIVFSTFAQGVYSYNFITKKIIETKLSSDEFRIVNLTIDRSNTVWLTTQFGLVKLKDNSKEYIDVEKGLPTVALTCVFQDRDNNIWIGTQGKGLIRAPRNELTYLDKKTGLTSDLVTSGFQSSNGNYYFGTYDVGIVKMSNYSAFRTMPLKFSNTVWSAQNNVDGLDWFGTRASLVSLSKEGVMKDYSEEQGTPGFKITCFLKINHQSMYVGGNAGVIKYDKGKFIEIGLERAKIGTARNLVLIDDVLYIATDLGLFTLVGKKFMLINDFDKKVFCLAKDENNTLYFGTEEGLFQLKYGKITRIKIASELMANYINFVNYRNGSLYVGTNNGMYILHGKNLAKSASVMHIGLSDGLVDLETNLNSSFFDRNGCFWFGTSAGLVKFNPKDFKAYQPNIKLKLDEILLNYQSFDYKKFATSVNDLGLPVNLSLPYNQNNLLFNFDGISINNYENINFQYWLEGLEKVWSPPSKNTSVNFAGLPPGEYTLHAKVLDIYGNAKERLVFKFTINSPFYLTWWFITLIVLLLAVAIISIFRFRIRREIEKGENERIAVKARLISLEQQSLNASMNRHFIFNSLNSIQYFINTSDKLSANKYLTNFAKLIRKNLDSSTENENMVTLAQELERIELYLSLESMRFKGKFNYTIETNGCDVESVIIPAMIIQPFVENSIIHGVLPNEDKVGEILINVYKENHDLYIVIQDNGIGIERSLAQKNEFSGDHKSQGMEITVKRIDLMKQVSHHILELEGPTQINGEHGIINGTRVIIKIRTENLED